MFLNHQTFWGIFFSAPKKSSDFCETFEGLLLGVDCAGGRFWLVADLEAGIRFFCTFVFVLGGKKLIRKGMMMKKMLVFLGVGVLIFCSCAIRITEKAVIAGQERVPYDSVRIGRYAAGAGSEALAEAVRSLPNRRQNVFYGDDSLTVVREYLAVNDSVTLEYFVFSPLRVTQTAYVFTGYGALNVGIFPSLMELSKRREVRVICLSYSGYGLSTGQFSVNGQFEYNQAFYDRLKGGNVGRVSVLGYSMGSIYASALAADNALDQLVLLAPISDVPDFLKQMKKNGMRGKYRLLKPFIKLKLDRSLAQISNVEKVQHFEGDLLIFHARDDGTLPFMMAEKLYQSSISEHKKLLLVDAGGHGAAFRDGNWGEIMDLGWR
jgi:esterase/lipase